MNTSSSKQNGNCSIETIIKSVLFILLLSFVREASLAVYKWVDDRGDVVYSDKPNHESATEFTLKQEEASSLEELEEHIPQQHQLLEILQQERTDKSTDRQQQKADKQQQRKKCAEVKEQYEKVQHASFLYEETGDPHNPGVLSNEQRQAAEKKYTDYLEKNC